MQIKAAPMPTVLLRVLLPPLRGRHDVAKTFITLLFHPYDVLDTFLAYHSLSRRLTTPDFTTFTHQYLYNASFKVRFCISECTLTRTTSRSQCSTLTILGTSVHLPFFNLHTSHLFLYGALFESCSRSFVTYCIR